MGSVRRWNFAGPDTTSTSCSRAAVLERQVILRQRTNDVEEKPAGDDGLARAWTRSVSSATRTPSSMSVACELGAAVLHAQEDAGEGLERAAGRRAAHGDAEPGEERFTGNGELQKMLPI